MFVRYLTSVLFNKSFYKNLKIVTVPSIHYNNRLINSRLTYNIFFDNYINNFNRTLSTRNQNIKNQIIKAEGIKYNFK